jgi:hypothetical protein
MGVKKKKRENSNKIICKLEKQQMDIPQLKKNWQRKGVSVEGY